jgi:hypothetical protein
MELVKKPWKIIASATASILLGVYFLSAGLTHRGSGVWLMGKAERGESGQIETDQLFSRIPERQYKRKCYVVAATFFVIAGGLAFEGLNGTRKPQHRKR